MKKPAMLAILLLIIIVTAGSSYAAYPAAFLQGTAAADDKFVTVFGAKIHYLEAGSGPVVILLHGLGGEGSNWAQTIGPLAEKYHVIAPDQIGFGRSDKPFMSYRVGTLVDFLDGFYKAMKIERASLVGNSLGGWTAAAFALAHPEKVDRLVLVDAAGFALPKDSGDVSIRSLLNPSTREGVRQLLSSLFYNKQIYTSDLAVDTIYARSIQTNAGYTIQRFLESVVRGEDVLDNRLSAIKQPTLIIWGREDQLTPLAGGERFNKEIAGSQLLVLDKCGHVPQIERAGEFNSALIKFLGGASQ